MLTDQEKERIEQEAKDKYPNTSFHDRTVSIIKQSAYITGATAHMEKAKVLVDALEQIKDRCERGIYDITDEAFIKMIIKQALKNYK
jgi:hypothetical protein